GIRDFHVTGVQTCALPIFETTGTGNLTVMTSYNRDSSGNVTTGTIEVDYTKTRLIDSASSGATGMLDKAFSSGGSSVLDLKVSEIGRASCRERLYISVGVG